MASYRIITTTAAGSFANPSKVIIRNLPLLAASLRERRQWRRLSLRRCAGRLGFTGPELKQLQQAIKKGVAGQTGHGIKPRTASWLGTIGTGIGNAVLTVSTKVAKAEATRAIPNSDNAASMRPA